MANSTITSTLVDNGVLRLSHEGMTTQSFQFGSGATSFGTNGDVALLANIPGGVTFQDFVVRLAGGGTSSKGRLVISHGGGDTTLVTDALAATITAVSAGLVHRGGFKPVNVSLSDDAATRYATLKLEVTGGTPSASFSLAGTVYYSRDAN